MSVAAYYLIMIVTTGKGVAIERVPMETQALCETAARQFKDLETTFSIYKSICVRGSSL